MLNDLTDADFTRLIGQKAIQVSDYDHFEVGLLPAGSD
jgi:hypothetical protein